MNYEALDIAPGGEQYLPFAQHLCRRMKEVLKACGLEQGYRHFKTPDGAGTIYIRARRSGGMWYDYIKIDGTVGGYIFKPYIAARQVSNFSLASVSLTGQQHCSLPFSGGKFKTVGSYGSFFPYVQMQSNKKNAKGLTSTEDGYIEAGVFTPLAFDLRYGSHGFFRHQYVDPVTGPQNVLLSLRRDSVPNYPIMNAETGVALSASGFGTSSANWTYSVSADGRTVLAHAYGSESGCYRIAIDFTTAPQAVWSSYTTIASPVYTVVTSLPLVTVTGTAWAELAYGTGTYAKTVSRSGGYFDLYTSDSNDYLYIAPGGEVGYVTLRYRYKTPVEIGPANEAYALAFRLNGSGFEVADITFSKSGSGETSISGPLEVEVVLPGGTSASFVLSSVIWSGSAEGEYVHGNVGTDTSESSSATYSATQRVGKLTIVYCDPLAKLLIYDYQVADVQQARTYTFSYIGANPPTVTDSRVQITVKTRTVGILSAARGNVVAFVEPGGTEVLSTTDTNPNTAPAADLFLNYVSPLWDPVGLVVAAQAKYGAGTGSAESTSVGSTSAANAYTLNLSSAGTPRQIRTDGLQARQFSISVAAKDSDNWVVSITRVRAWNGDSAGSGDGDFLNPNTFDVFTARLNDAAVRRAFLDELETELRATGNTAAADNVALGVLDPYEVQLHARGAIGVVKQNDSTASFVTDNVQ